MIRTATLQDVPAILEIYRPYILETAYTFEYEVPSLEAFEQRFLTISREFPWLVWEDGGEVLGYAYAERPFARAAYQWDADLAIYLRRDCRGKGLGRKLYEQVEDILYRQGYHVLYAVVTSANLDSCRFHEAMGYEKTAEFTRCGWKFGQWYGTIWYEKRLQEGEPQHPPVGVRAIAERSE